MEPAAGWAAVLSLVFIAAGCMVVFMASIPRSMMKDMWGDLVKNHARRIPVWIAWLIVGVLIDQYVKDGVWWSMHDVFAGYPTHENIVLFLLVAEALSLLYLCHP